MNILIPGRHHLLTKFQWEYYYDLIHKNLEEDEDINNTAYKNNKNIQAKEGIDNIIFAITSANHANTRRNPLPLYMRAMMIEQFSEGLDVPAFLYPIDDVGALPGTKFAEYTLKKINNASDGRFNLTPQNTIVACSTEVLEMYEALGFAIAPTELSDRNTWTYRTGLPWEIVTEIAKSEGDWKKNKAFVEQAHPSTQKIWKKYDIGDNVKMLFADHMIGADGDITETRDYGVYVRQMDEIAEQKYNEVSPFIRPGRVGDIGCAVGSWIKFASEDPRLLESDFHGIEIARKLYDECQHRKERGDFVNPYVFFWKRNAVTGFAFEKGSMNTIHTSSLTHEIKSYGKEKSLEKFVYNRFDELAHGGVWINRDVVGPEDKDRTIVMKLNAHDGKNSTTNDADLERSHNALSELSTAARFKVFAKDFRHQEGYKLAYTIEKEDAESLLVQLRLEDACEFMSKKDYTDNWKSEMHEQFCFWSSSDWKNNLKQAGFNIHPASYTFRNEWIVKNRYEGKVELYTLQNGILRPFEYPISHMVMIAEKL
ncbi:MAG: transferase [Candidatus Woesearchaeota archaeon]